MTQVTKNRKTALGKYDKRVAFPLQDAAKVIRDITTTKFDASVDMDVRLGVDPRKAKRVLVLCTPDKEDEAKEAGADYIGLDDYIKKIEGGWTDIDVVITMPSVMAKVGKLGKILGPRGLMPNPKSGTVTMDIGKAVTEVKAGKIDFKVDKYGIVHAAIGNVTFTDEMLADNARELIQTIVKLKPASAKGTYIRSIYMSSTMSPSVKVDQKSVTM
jgi:large subunit ribosomal protein L1